MARGTSIVVFIIIDLLISDVVSKDQGDATSNIQGNDNMTAGT